MKNVIFCLVTLMILMLLTGCKKPIGYAKPYPVTENYFEPTRAPEESTNQADETVVWGEFEPTEMDIPVLSFGGALAQTKSAVVMSFQYQSATGSVSGYCTTKAQGTSSMAYPKKNQTVKFYADEACTEPLELDFHNWGGQNKFCLKANWIDITHSRNIVSARLWADVVMSRNDYESLPEALKDSPNQGVIDGFPILVYADGEYQGRYTLNIPKDAWMANMDEDNPNHCILLGETNAGAAYFRDAAVIDGTDWSDEIHDTVPETIRTRWNEIIQWVQTASDEMFVEQIQEYFDLQSLIDYYLFSLASNNSDGFGKNQMFLTYDGLKWYASAYDLDTTWGLSWDGTYFQRVDQQDYLYEEGNLLYWRLSQLFRPQMVQRWQELRSTVLSQEHIMERFESFMDVCSQELVQQDYAEGTAGGAFTNMPSVETNNLEQIRSYTESRLAWADRKMGMDALGAEIQGYTNQIPISTDENGALFNGCGYRENATIADGQIKNSKGVSLTGYIPCRDGDVIRLKNMTFTQGQSNHRLYFYDADKNLVGYSAGDMPWSMDTKFTGITDEFGNYTSFQVVSLPEISENCAYVRICCGGITRQSVVSVNEGIF